ncbi:MAG: PAS domain S-box protein [Desulfobacterales bacterium]|nr:PAS domain S-box protein [Desulfobacterales bacterium]
MAFIILFIFFVVIFFVLNYTASKYLTSAKIDEMSYISKIAIDDIHDTHQDAIKHIRNFITTPDIKENITTSLTFNAHISSSDTISLSALNSRIYLLKQITRLYNCSDLARISLYRLSSHNDIFSLIFYSDKKNVFIPIPTICSEFKILNDDYNEFLLKDLTLDSIKSIGELEKFYIEKGLKITDNFTFNPEYEIDRNNKYDIKTKIILDENSITLRMMCPLIFEKSEGLLILDKVLDIQFLKLLKEKIEKNIGFTVGNKIIESTLNINIFFINDPNILELKGEKFYYKNIICFDKKTFDEDIGIAVFNSVSDINDITKKIRFRIALILLICILVLLIAILTLTQKIIIQPLITLEENASEIAKGNLDKTINIKRLDELGSLAQSFIEMKNSVSQKIHDLERNEARFRALVESTSDWIWEMNSKHVYTYCSPKIKDLLGYEPDEVVGNTPSNFMISTEGHQLSEFCGKLKKNRFPFKGMENIFIHKDARPIVIETSGVPILDEKGNYLGHRGVSRDITERKKIIESLQIKDFAISCSISAISISDLSGELKYANQACLKLWGYDNIDEVIGKPITMFWDGKQKAIDILHIIQKEGCWIGNAKGKRKDGTIFPAQVMGSLVENDYGDPVCMIGSFLDISELKNAEHLMRIEDKMSSLGRIASGIAHEIRSPLSALNMFISALKKILIDFENIKAADIKKMEKVINNIQAASNKIEIIIKKIMDFTRPSAPKFKLSCINNSIDKAVDLCEAFIKKSGIKIETSLYSNLPSSYIDSNMMEQVFVNLINNAAQAMINQNENQNQNQKRIEIKTLHDNDNIIISISDSGSGIPLSIQEKIFDPFFTTKNDGTGIGLSIVYRIITDHQGKIEINKNKNDGAEFIIYLPIFK